MTAKPILATSSETTDPSWWGALLVGAIFIFAGLFVLGDVVAATVISAVLIGIVLVVAGASEVFQAFLAQHWRGFLLRLLVGALYVVCGFDARHESHKRLRHSHSGIRVISDWISGLLRIFQAILYWQWFGWLLLVSGIVGIAAGLFILSQWPISGLWALGFLVGVDLLLHGLWWISLGSRLRQERNTVPV